MRVKPLLIQASRAVVAVILAVVPITQITPPWWLLTALGAFIFGSEFISARVDKSRSRRLQSIQHRALRVIADLASGTADRYDLWVVDMYLPELGWSYSRGIRKRLVRALSLSLTDVQRVPPEIEISDSNPLARCYSETEQLTWWDPALKPMAEDDDSHPCEVHDELKDTYGAVSVNPIVNNTGHDCRGILVVHTKPDPELVTTAVGILNSSRGRRHISESCHDIHGHLKA